MTKRLGSARQDWRKLQKADAERDPTTMKMAQNAESVSMGGDLQPSGIPAVETTIDWSRDSGLDLFLGRLTACVALNGEEQQAILALPHETVRLQARRDFLLTRGAAPFCCVVASGMVGRFGQARSGMRQIIGLYAPGEMAVLRSVGGSTGLGGLNALCETSILRVPYAALQSVMTRHPAIAEALWWDRVRDEAPLAEWALNIGRRNARARIANLLCEMAIRSGGGGSLFKYAFPLTQAQLGDALALTAVHVNRSLRALRKEGIVTFCRPTVEIHDWAKLVRAGEFDDAYLT